MSTDLNDDSLNFYNKQKQKNHDVPIESLDYKYIAACANVKELEKIYKVLVSGVEGKYPDLEKFACEKLTSLSPNSRVLRKDKQILSKKSIPLNEQSVIDAEIDDFVKSMPAVESKLFNSSTNNSQQRGHKENAYSEIPPIRATKVINPSSAPVYAQESKQEVKRATPKPSTKSPKPKDYKEWSKIEKELEKQLDEVDEVKEPSKSTTINNTSINLDEKQKQAPKNLKDIPKLVDAENLDDDVRVIKADQEKCKGNESFNAGSYEEALVYYTRSIQYMPNSASYNNRALAYLKLEKWDKAIDDCKEVLTYEPENIKALLRRANAFLKKKSYAQAKTDIEKCIQLSPSDRKAQDLRAQIEMSLKRENEEQEKVKARGGNRLKIEDTDGSSNEEDEEKIEKIDMKKTVTSSNATISASTPLTKKQEPVEKTDQKKKIKITEVENDDDEEDDRNGNQLQPTKPISEINDNLKPKQEILEQKPSVNYDLPKLVVDFKDKAHKFFTSGAYGDAAENYTKAIEILTKNLTTTRDEDEKSFLQNNLVVLYNNRASSSQKICEFKSCIKDCDLGLELLPELSASENSKNLMLKLLSKKADSFEKLEKFTEAFLVLQSLMKIDNKFNNVQLNYNRVKNVLKESGELGKVVSSSHTAHTPSLSCKADSAEEIKMNKEIDKVPQSKEKLYEENKSKGNECVKEKNFEKAIKFYTECIQIDAENPIAYLNRSLCYLKNNKADLSFNDSNFVLEKDSRNVKALFRRAMSYKMKLNYDLAIADLKIIVSLEKDNQLAIQELDELNALKKAASEKNLPTANKKKIIMLDEDYSTVTPATQEKKQPIQTNNKIVQEKVTPVISSTRQRPSISKITNAYEFLQYWNSIKPQDTNSFAHLLVNVEPENLPKYIGSKLDDAMLTTLLNAIQCLINDTELLELLSNNTKGTKSQPIDYLKFIAKSQRFNVIKLFLSQEQKKTLKNILSLLKNVKSEDINMIKKDYDL
jgi:tetratricopeptide (TPR) repeat protein